MCRKKTYILASSIKTCLSTLLVNKLLSTTLYTFVYMLVSVLASALSKRYVDSKSCYVVHTQMSFHYHGLCKICVWFLINAHRSRWINDFPSFVACYAGL